LSDLRLSLAVNESLHTRDLIDGRVKAEGIDLVASRIEIEAAILRFGLNQEFDIAEVSLANFCGQIARNPQANMIGLPVFTSRAFRQSAIYVSRTSGLRAAGDLAGCTVGIPQWSQTATVYVRGFLAHLAGVPLSSIRWIQAGLDQPGRRDNLALSLPDDIRLEVRPDDTLSDMLTSGRIDAIISARPPKAFYPSGGDIRRLFADPRIEEEKYFRATGVFPIMHLIALRRDVYERNRWIARNLYDAFERAKVNALALIMNEHAPYIPAPWAADRARSGSQMVFGEGGAWPYGLAPNLNSIEAFLDYAFEQGVTLRRLDCDELFARETLSVVRV